MIKKIQLVAFKGFKDFSVNLFPFTNLVGLNSQGKTTILQAIDFVYGHVRTVFGNTDRPTFPSSINWNLSAGPAIQRVTYNDTSALWLNRNTAIPCQVVLTLDDGTEIDASVVTNNECKLVMRRGGRILTNASLQDGDKTAITNFIEKKILFVPPIGGTSPSEQFLNHTEFESQRLQGRIAELFRNYLHWTYNDGDKSRFDRVVEIVHRYIPESRILPPRLSHDNPVRVMIEFEEADHKYDISASGAGLRTLINLASVLVLSDSRVLLFDEPDAHLHSSLQRAVARMLVDYVAEQGTQVIVATHAPDFIAEVPTESLVWIDRAARGGREINELGRTLIDLGAVSKSDVVMSGSTESVLYVEGTLDRKILGAFCKKALLQNPFDISGKTLVAKLLDGKSSNKAVEHLPALLKKLLNRPVRVSALYDQDCELANGDGEHGNAFILPRKEVENFLLDAEVFARAAAADASRRGERTNSEVTCPTQEDINKELHTLLENEKQDVRNRIIWQYRERLDSSIHPSTKEDMAEKWFNTQWEKPGWPLAMVPGKTVLKNLRTWCQTKYKLTVTDSQLINEITVVPVDLKEILRKVVESLAVGEIEPAK